MRDHQLEIWTELFQIIESHHTLQLLAVELTRIRLVISFVNLSQRKLFIEVKNHDLLNIVPLASDVEGVRVIVNQVGRNDIAMVDRVVQPLVDFYNLTFDLLHVHDEHFGLSPAD